MLPLLWAPPLRHCCFNTANSNNLPRTPLLLPPPQLLLPTPALLLPTPALLLPTPALLLRPVRPHCISLHVTLLLPPPVLLPPAPLLLLLPHRRPVSFVVPSLRASYIHLILKILTHPLRLLPERLLKLVLSQRCNGSGLTRLNLRVIRFGMASGLGIDSGRCPWLPCDCTQLRVYSVRQLHVSNYMVCK